MKNKTIYLLLLLLVSITISCSSDASEINLENLENFKNVTDCNMTIEPDTLISICLDGANLALPNEIITFASTFYTKNDNPADTQFSWSIVSGNMEVLNVENSTDGLIAKSIATIKFNSDYSGNGIISVNAENNSGNGSKEHLVGLQ